MDFFKRNRNMLYIAASVAVITAVFVFFISAGKGCSDESFHSDKPGVEQTEQKQTENGKEYINNGEESGDPDSDENNGNPEGKEEQDNGDKLDGAAGVTNLHPLVKDLVSENSTNVLILGEDQMYGLMDTVGIMSIDRDSQKIKIIMIPRDTYIGYNKKVLEFMKAYNTVNEPGAFKINYAYYLGWYIHDRGRKLNFKGKFDNISYGVSFITQVVEEKFSLTIHDFIKVDTEGFVNAVDLFGGVDIYVPYDMDYEDPAQDLYIHLDKGMQQLDGKQAEGFVRFRTGVDDNGKVIEYGDVERKRNQQAFLKAFIDQHGTITNADKIPGLLDILGRRVWSSIKPSDVLFRYIGLVKDIIKDGYTVESVTLVGELRMIRGSSYIVIEPE